MNKSPRRRGKVQLIDATEIWMPMRRSLGNKRRQISPEQIDEIIELYTLFEEGERCRILPNEEFLYKEYTVKQPLQRSYQITPDRIDALAEGKFKDDLHNPAKVEELSIIDEADMTAKQRRQLAGLLKAEPVFEQMLQLLRDNVMDEPTQDYKGFEKFVKDLFSDLPDYKKKETPAQRKSVVDKVVDAMSEMDKTASIRHKRDGSVVYDDATKDTELVKLSEDVDDYFEREVYPFVPDAKWFDEEDENHKKTGAEIPFTRYFYKYEAPESSEKLLAEFDDLEAKLQTQIKELMD
jgi:type I restriction enzyme M protein